MSLLKKIFSKNDVPVVEKTLGIEKGENPELVIVNLYGDQERKQIINTSSVVFKNNSRVHMDSLGNEAEIYSAKDWRVQNDPSLTLKTKINSFQVLSEAELSNLKIKLDKNKNKNSIFSDWW